MIISKSVGVLRALGLTAAAMATVIVVSGRPAAAAPIDVPAGNERELSLNGIGVQIYDCKPSTTAASGYAWTFRAPEATLFNRAGKVVGIHYAGPTWESTRDGSKVVGKRLASAPSPDGAIPWLLLSGSVSAPGETFGAVTYIQRIETTGGVAPATGCDDASNVDIVTRVPYTATYLFYEAE